MRFNRDKELRIINYLVDKHGKAELLAVLFKKFPRDQALRILQCLEEAGFVLVKKI